HTADAPAALLRGSVHGLEHAAHLVQRVRGQPFARCGKRMAQARRGRVERLGEVDARRCHFFRSNWAVALIQQALTAINIRAFRTDRCAVPGCLFLSATVNASMRSMGWRARGTSDGSTLMPLLPLL